MRPRCRLVCSPLSHVSTSQFLVYCFSSLSLTRKSFLGRTIVPLFQKVRSKCVLRLLEAAYKEIVGESNRWMQIYRFVYAHYIPKRGSPVNLR